MSIFGIILIVIAGFLFLTGYADNSAVRATMNFTIGSGFMVSGSIFIVGNIIKSTIESCFELKDSDTDDLE